jgi:hypothetical protein
VARLTSTAGRADEEEVMRETTLDSDAVLARFNRLIQELLSGSIKRNCFRPWEIEVLLDIEACDLRPSGRRETLRRYQRAVRRHLENGGVVPLKLSEYLALRRSRARRGAQTPG